MKASVAWSIIDSGPQAGSPAITVQYDTNAEDTPLSVIIDAIGKALPTFKSWTVILQDGECVTANEEMFTLATVLRDKGIYTIGIVPGAVKPIWMSLMNWPVAIIDETGWLNYSVRQIVYTPLAITEIADPTIHENNQQALRYIRTEASNKELLAFLMRSKYGWSLSPAKPMWINIIGA